MSWVLFYFERFFFVGVVLLCERVEIECSGELNMLSSMNNL